MSPKKDLTPLPTERDFDPFIGDLDAQCAWQNFGGLTLEEAMDRFRENPLRYQEDFMFMGGRAFAFYFPVIEMHLRSVVDEKPYGDSEAWILAHCIRQQFYGEILTEVRHLAPRVCELSAYVQSHNHLFGADEIERHRVAEAWNDLVDHVRNVIDDSKLPSDRN